MDRLTSALTPLAADRALYDQISAPILALISALISARSAELNHRPVRLAVACSGGRDSQTLAGMTLSLASSASSEPMTSELIILTVDHGLYEGSDESARALQAYWSARGAQCEVLRADPELIALGEGVEDGARRARYHALEEAAARHQLDLILLGHHAGDQAETFLMRALSSAGLRSLGGIPERRGVFARPWLKVDPTLIQRACDALALPIFEDPTNRDPRFTRNAIRLQIAPTLEALYGPEWITRVTRTASHLAADSRALSALITRRLESAITLSRSSGIARLDWSEGLEELDEVARVGLRAFYQRALFELTAESSDRRRTRAQLELIEAVWRGESHQRRSLPLGLELWGGRGVIEIYSAQVALTLPESISIDLPSTPDKDGHLKALSFEWGPWRLALTPHINPRSARSDDERPERGADLARAAQPLTLSLPTEGARYQPYRSPGSKRVRRLWGDRKRSVFERERLPVLMDAEARVLWAPHCRPAAWLYDPHGAQRADLSVGSHTGHTITWLISWAER